MSTVVQLCIAGWVIALFLVALLFGARRVNRDWRKLCAAKDDIIRDLERRDFTREHEILSRRGNPPEQ